MLTSSIGDTGLPLNLGFQSYGTLYSLHNIKYAISKFQPRYNHSPQSWQVRGVSVSKQRGSSSGGHGGGGGGCAHLGAHDTTAT